MNSSPRPLLQRLWWLLLLAWVLVAIACQLGWMREQGLVQHDGAENLAPGADHWLGTDHLGRDLFAQCLQGSRIALLIGGLAAAAAVALGTLLGLWAAWSGRWFDAFCHWLAGAIAAIPGMLLVLVLAAILGHGIGPLCVAFALAAWVGVFRLVRSESGALVRSDAVVAARLAGAGSWRILRVHVLPGLRPILSAQFSLAFVSAVKVEAVLAFLGVGLIEQSSWGRMIADSWALGDLEQGRWWRLTAATLSIALLTLPVHRLADGASDVSD